MLPFQGFQIRGMIEASERFRAAIFPRVIPVVNDCGTLGIDQSTLSDNFVFAADGSTNYNYFGTLRFEQCTLSASPYS